MIRMLCLISMVMFIPLSLVAEERDPFVPYLFETPASVVDSEDTSQDAYSTVRPLNDNPLKSYKLIGVIISPQQSVAVVQGPSRREYFVSVGDELGSEGGVIESMTVEGLSVDLGTELVNLKVTNKFEIQNDN